MFTRKNAHSKDDQRIGDRSYFSLKARKIDNV